MKKDQSPPRKKNAPPVDDHRSLPASVDAEMGLLSSILLGPDAVLPLCDDRGVTDAWFYIPAHGVIYFFCVSIRKAQLPLDFISLTQHLTDNGRLDEVGGAGFITSLFTYLPSYANAAYYIEVVAQKHAARRLIAVCTEFAARAYEDAEIGNLIDEAQAAVLTVNRPDSTGTETIQQIKPAVIESVTAIQETYEHRGGVVGLPTGFHQLDRMTGGMKGPLLIIVAGRPSMGKSAFIWNIGEYLAIERKDTILGFSLEMNNVELAGRMVCGRAEINLQRVRDGFLSRHQMESKLPTAATAVASAQIFIDDTPGLSIQELRVRVRRFIKQHPETAVVIVDYLQLLRSNSKRAQDNRNLEIAEISSGLKSLAKEINRPIISAAQLNRDNDGANNKPKLSNLRESGSIEQDADWVILLHRRHYYTKNDEDKGKANADLAKQRNGPTGDVALAFDHELGRFKNPEGQELYSNDPSKRQQSTPEDDE